MQTNQLSPLSFETDIPILVESFGPQIRYKNRPTD